MVGCRVKRFERRYRFIIENGSGASKVTLALYLSVNNVLHYLDLCCIDVEAEVLLAPLPYTVRS